MQLGSGSLASLARLREFKRRRLSSWDRTGGNRDFVLVPASARVELGRIAGAGCVKHIWVTTMAFPPEEHELCSLVLRIWWDGEASPSVEVPLGDFFGIGFGLRRNFVSLPLQMSPQDGRGMNCWFPMPFATGARFEIENQGSRMRVFYFYVDYEEYPRLDGELARFHACWNRTPQTAGTDREKGYGPDDYASIEKRLAGPWAEPNLDGARNYSILEVRGRGQYVGCVLNIDVFERQLDDWYGEGDDMIFIDEELDDPPRLHGTGTEDYFNTAFCPQQEYCAPYHGLTVYSGTPDWPWRGKNSMYRFHIEDPIRFEKSIRVTIETGHANALANDYSSTAYWYQLGRSEALRALPPLSARLPRPDPPAQAGA